MRHPSAPHGDEQLLHIWVRIVANQRQGVEAGEHGESEKLLTFDERKLG